MTSGDVVSYLHTQDYSITSPSGSYWTTKLFASNAAFESADRAVQVFGGRGYSELYRPGRHFKDVRVCRIYEGTDEILKLKIAAAVLGKEYAAFR